MEREPTPLSLMDLSLLVFTQMPPERAQPVPQEIGWPGNGGDEKEVS
jgi:hypothetical protein